MTLIELNQFHEFAIETIRLEGDNVSLLQLFRKWLALKEREEVNAAIRVGLAEMAAGQGRPANECMAELRQKFGISDAVTDDASDVEP